MTACPSARRCLHSFSILFAVTLLLGSLGACTSESSESLGDEPSLQASSIPDSMTIPRMLETDDRFSMLRAALDSTGLDSLLATDGPYTLFAPPNKAFEALPPGTMEALLTEQTERLRTILAQHIVEGQVSTNEDSTPQSVVTLAGDTLTLDRTNERATIGEVAIIDGNIEASGGLLHVLDQVLPPPSADRTP
ncbi:MAG: fasciclin domain-containing protein [Salinibacter sp.]